MMNVLSGDSDCETYSETSDSEDQDDCESSYSGNAQSILSNLDESIGKIDDFLAYERGFVHGDIVCSITDPYRQLGRVVDIDMVVDLETSSGELLRDVNSKKLQKVHAFSSGDYVVHGQWFGRVDRTYDVVTILFNDGARCEIRTGDSEILVPVSPSPFEDSPYIYCPGQRVRIKLPTFTKSIRWLCGSWKATREEGTVCKVEVGLVHVNWIASVRVSYGVVPSAPPHLQAPENLKLLSCFPYANWQLGDWCTLPFGYLNDLKMTAETFSPPSIAPQCLAKMQKLGMGYGDCKGMYVIARTKTKVDVLWQNGCLSVGLDSQTLSPVNNVGDHDFWPEQFVLEKVMSDEVHVLNDPRVGIVKNVDAQERTVMVKWKTPNGQFSEETVSAYELIEHPDFSYCVGDVVFRVFPHFKNSEENPLNIQISGQSKMSDLPCRGHFSSSLPFGSEPKKKQINDGNVGEESDYLSCIGNVIGFKDEAIEVKWATGLISKVQPSDIFGLDRLDDQISMPAVFEDAVSENVGREMAEHDRQPLLEEEAERNPSKDHEKERWDTSSLFFPSIAFGFLKKVATSLFHSSCSASLSDSWKEVSNHQILTTEEPQLDVDDLEAENLAQQVEVAELNENSKLLPGNRNLGMLKQFDIVDDYLDHHFVNDPGQGLVASQTSQVKRGWLKKVQQEWSILRNDLPDSIYVRVYEARMDLLRACIVGPPGTPYHDGLFFFDMFLPPDYPNEPPMVHYKSGGLRLNPNLYESGKVCLSLLKTWTGTGTEVWSPENSTILQVLLSLQALVLNDKPYFNEAGYDKQMGRAEAEKNAITYNENAFLLSCKSMLYLLQKKPKHFEALVEEHFSHRSHCILLACKAYMDGARVGHAFETGRVAGEGDQKSCSTGFKIMLAKLFPKLVSGFTEMGIDCSQFLE